MDSRLEAVSFDESHCVKRSAIGVRSHAIDWNNAWMLQRTRDFGFLDEPPPALRTTGVFRLDLLEGHLSVQFLIISDRDLAQTAAGMGPQNAKSSCRSGRKSHADDSGRIGVG